MNNIQKQHKISPAIAWLTIQKFIIFYCPLDGEHTIIKVWDFFIIMSEMVHKPACAVLSVDTSHNQPDESRR